MEVNSENILVFVLIGCLLVCVLSVFIVFFVLSYRKKQADFMLEKQQLQSQYQEILLQSQIEIQEQTLHNISQEIHDNIGQVLSLAKLNIGTMDINQPSQLQEKINCSRDLVGKAIQDLRQLAKTMNSTFITEAGLVGAIEAELEIVRKSGVLLAHLYVEGQPVRTDPQKELILFRIFQEVMTNIIKHATAEKVEIRIGFSEELLNITISDNGKGFDTATINASEKPASGLGLRNMQHRARLIDANLSITSIPEKGTTVAIRLPLTT